MALNQVAPSGLQKTWGQICGIIPAATILAAVVIGTRFLAHAALR